MTKFNNEFKQPLIKREKKNNKKLEIHRYIQSNSKQIENNLSPNRKKIINYKNSRDKKKEINLNLIKAILGILFGKIFLKNLANRSVPKI